PGAFSDDATNNNDNDIPTIDDPIFAANGIAVGPDNAIYVSDGVGGRIYKVLASGRVLRIAGTGTPGFSGDDGPATSAQLHAPSGAGPGPRGEPLLWRPRQLPHPKNHARRRDLHRRRQRNLWKYRGWGSGDFGSNRPSDRGSRR